LEDEGRDSAVAWGAVIAGGITSAALMLMLLAFGTGIGLSVVSPWADSGVSSTTFSLGAGLYLIVVAMLASTVAGYLAGRLRTKWVGVHTDEVYFRDTAHGFLAWAFGTVLSAAVLGAAATHIIAGASSGLSQAGASAAAQPGSNAGGPADIYVDTLFRPAPGAASAGQPATPPADPSLAPGAGQAAAPAPASAASRNAGSPTAARSEITRLFTRNMAKGADFSAADRAYVSQVVSTRTGLSQAEADKRVTEVTTQAKAAADAARRGAAKLSLWLAASMLAGALAASLAATEGGQLRDGRWRS
jgi:hypothetical protein